MKFTGLITKMITEKSSPIHYYINFEEEFINVNQLIEKKINIKFIHYQCLRCGKDKEIFAMGHCKSCYFLSPLTGEWIVRPELSTAHLGKADRDLTIESEAQLQPHIVYIANSGGIKIGVTRKSQIPTRWIDQGAEYAIRLAETKNRYEAGVIESILKNHLADKTNYRKMLSGNAEFIDLIEIKNKIKEFVPKELSHYIIENNEIEQLQYPILSYPSKINSLNLKKNKSFEGILMGIKGQYLLFDNNIVFNVRNHEGFIIDLTIN